jgi:RNA polymerase sigma-70 factor (ECF subfamily)
MPPEAPSSSLLLLMKRRDPDGWRRFLRLYGPSIYSWCRARWHLSQEDAADVVQEVIRSVVEQIDVFRDGNFVVWLSTITRSRAVDHRRENALQGAGGSDALKVLAELPDPRALPSADGTAEDEEVERAAFGSVLYRAVEEVRRRAAPTSWQAFWQVVVNGRSPKDVAQDLGLTENAVYIAKYNILRRLKLELGEC